MKNENIETWREYNSNEKQISAKNTYLSNNYARKRIVAISLKISQKELQILYVSRT